MELGLLGLSENLLPEIQQDRALEVLGPARELEFDARGNLVSLVAEAEAALAQKE